MVGYGVNGLGDINDEFSIELAGGENGDRIRPVVVRLPRRVLCLAANFGCFFSLFPLFTPQIAALL